MDERLLEDAQWLSTYGLITVQRILETFHIFLPPQQLFTVLKKPKSFYHLLLRLPLKNIANGIILQQADEYHLYSQKLLIDYLLSEENIKDESSPGNTTRENLEEEREKLITLGEEKSKVQLKHNDLIAKSQNTLKAFVSLWQKNFEKAATTCETLLKQQGQEFNKGQIKEALQYVVLEYSYDQALAAQGNPLLVDLLCTKFNISKESKVDKALGEKLSILFTLSPSFDEEVHALQEKIYTINEQLKSFRSLFYESTLHIVELIKLLPGYRADSLQDSANREFLYFDKSLLEN